MNKTAMILGPALCLSVLLSGCLPDAPSNTGTLRVSLTDAPACGMNEVNVTISRIRVHTNSTALDSDDGWQDIVVSPARKINLLDLSNGLLEELGQTDLPTGHYTQLRLMLDSDTSGDTLPNSVFATGDSQERPLIVPSALQSGIKLVGEFDISDATLTDLTLDFDACRSIVTQGNHQYRLKPVIRVVPNLLSGSIKGVIDAALQGATPRVMAEINGEVVKQVVPDPVTGAFNLAPLIQSSSAGNYSIVIIAEDHAASVITDVPVSAQTETTISTVAHPLTLTVSSEHTVSGTVTPVLADTTAMLSVSQLVGSGRYNLGWSEANAASGAYQMSLPLTAPSLAAWDDGALPLSFTPQDSAAGLFALTASIPGYAPQTRDLDLRTSDQLLDFLLVIAPL